MINEKCKEEVCEFLTMYSAATIRVATTMKDGFVKCIKPIPTICGAELMCSPETSHELRTLIKAQIDQKGI